MFLSGKYLIAILFAVITLISACSADRSSKKDDKTAPISSSERERINELILTAWEYRLEAPDASLAQFEEARIKSKELRYSHGEGMAQVRLAMTKWRDEPAQAKLHFDQAKAIFEKEDDKSGKIYILIALGMFRAETAKSDIHESIKDYQHALMLCEPQELYSYQLFELFIRISMNFRTSGDNLNSKLFIERAHPFIKTPAHQALYHNQLANTLWLMGNTESALDHYGTSLLRYKELNMPRRAAGILFNIGLSEYERKNYSIALKNFEEASLVSERSKDKIFRLRVKLNQARLFDDLNKPDLAEEALLTSQDLLKQVKSHRLEADVYQAISEHNKKRGRIETALIYLERYIKARENLLDQTRTEALAQAQEELGTRIKDQEIVILKKEKQLQLIAFSTVLIIAGLVLFFLIKKVSHLLAFWKKQKYIGQYRLIKRIGGGGMGVVFMAQSLKDKSHHVAIKILKEELLADEENRKRFKREGEIIDRLLHPNIVRVFERGEDNGRYYLALEYLPGRTLEERIKEATHWPLHQKLHVLIQICSALRAVHEAGIVHRDLKPSNIMICTGENETEQAKLLDFGLAQLWYHSKLTQTGIIMGTLCYQAPEQFETLSSGPQVDIYALGLVFYEILSETPLGENESLATLSRKVLSGQIQESFSFPVEIPTELSKLVMAMTHQDCHRRPRIQLVNEILITIEKSIKKKGSSVNALNLLLCNTL